MVVNLLIGTGSAFVALGLLGLIWRVVRRRRSGAPPGASS
jgi:hypothetical protein